MDACVSNGQGVWIAKHELVLGPGPAFSRHVDLAHRTHLCIQVGRQANIVRLLRRSLKLQTGFGQ